MVLYASNFDAGVDGWTVLDSGVTIAVRPDPAPPTGTNSLAVTRTTLDETQMRFGRVVTGFVPGVEYRLAMQMMRTNTTGTSGLGLGVAGISTTVITQPGANVWALAEYLFTATATSHQIVTAGRGTGTFATRRIHIDDVTVEPVNVPVTATAPLSGSGALSASAKPGMKTTRSLSGSGVLSSVAKPLLRATAALSGVGALSVSARPAVAAQAILSGLGALAGSANPHLSSVAALSGTGVLSAYIFQPSEHAYRAALFIPDSTAYLIREGSDRAVLTIEKDARAQVKVGRL